MRFGKRAGARASPFSRVPKEALSAAPSASTLPRTPLALPKATEAPRVFLSEAQRPASWDRLEAEPKYLPALILSPESRPRALEDFEAAGRDGIEYEVDLRRRRRRRDASRGPEDAAPRFSRGSRPSGGDAAARGPTRRKRSTVYEIIESLMELLGLETLPVDPRFYGCHELVLPFYT